MIRQGLLPVLFLLLAGLLLSSCSYRFHASSCKMELPGMLVHQCTLDPEVNETSGLLYLDGKFWTFNDSGGEAALYCMDEDGRLLHKLVVENASNVDWEDVAGDSLWVYVADVGNNFASRDTLSIYRIPLEALRSSVGNSGVSYTTHEGIIELSYSEKPEQTSRGWSSLDCEALLSWETPSTSSARTGWIRALRYLCCQRTRDTTGFLPVPPIRPACLLQELTWIR